MNLPMKWLNEYTTLKDIDIKTFVDKMTMSGSKVEVVEHLGEKLHNIVVGRIESIIPHPNADKLVITQTNIGSEVLQIVTGAKNLSAGDYVPVAIDGAILADGTKIKNGKLRGETSNGMLCSIEELGYTTHDYPEAPEDGIYIFSEPQELGADVREILQLCEDVVEFEITSNRVDCFSIVGLAREAAATFGADFRYPQISVKETADGNINEMISVEIRNPELCPRYIARVVKNVKIEPSPLWLRRRLTASGVRPINNIVDITNYVMLELGQPMHAFDIDSIEGRTIIVRNAEDNEALTTLDGEVHELDSSMLVIADKNRAVALAGVMGGENSMITGTAGAVLFESACFNGTNIRRTAKKVGMRTDASAKYEKGLDPNLALASVNRAVQLVELLGAGEVVKGCVDCYPNVRKPWTIEYSPQRINALLGTDISTEQMVEYLQALDITAKDGVAHIPTNRSDLLGEEDIAEEIARLYGYDNIPETLTSGTPTVGKQTTEQLLEGELKNLMTAHGYSEALTYAFESPSVLDKLLIPAGSPLRNAIKIQNPLGEDYSLMRTTTVNGILSSLATNFAKRNESAALFEIAKKYLPKSLPLTDFPEEVKELTAAGYNIGDFYTIKGIVEAVGAYLGVELDFDAATDIPFMHPGRTAEVSLVYHGKSKPIGFVGELHLTVLENYGIPAKTRVLLASLELAPLFAAAQLKRSYVPISRYPAIKRDIALVVRDEVPAKDIRNIINKRGGALLDHVDLFDVYKGTGLSEGHKSLAYSITFRAPDRSLTDNEVGDVLNRILASLKKELGAELRS